MTRILAIDTQAIRAHTTRILRSRAAYYEHVRRMEMTPEERGREKSRRYYDKHRRKA